MTTLRRLVFSVCALLAMVPGARAEQLVSFHPDPDYLRLPDSWTFGACSAVAVGRDGKVFLLHRGEQ